MIIPQTTEVLAQIANSIRRGGVIAFRTDTFYGLGADPFNHAAVRKIKQLKGREDGKPILIVISGREQINRFIAERTKAFDVLSEEFWPGPLTLICKAAPGLPEEITAGTGTVGVRLPDDDNVCALVRECGGALTATSANPADHEPARTAQEVSDYFRKAIDLIVDGGPARSDLPSTVVDVSQLEPRLIREGVIAWSDIRVLRQGG
ncbi:MAG TPA: L-threonylcarbamoyladenylate synthase [Blastocatellia bacterium]|nr:L-threonylcarbamoyladenylate synthase [Blastocatellia bacterium]